MDGNLVEIRISTAGPTETMIKGGNKSKEPVTQKQQRGEILSVGINALEESGCRC